MKDIQEDILRFWFEETNDAQWFQKSDDFDAAIKDRFLKAYDLAMEGQFDAWQNDAKGALALIILLDQMPRNMFRDTPKAFASDEKVLEIAKQAVAQDLDKAHPTRKRRFMYLPYEHSENIEDQQQCVALFEQIKEDDAQGYEYAIKHMDVIKAFDRFPHRNDILGRESTAAEKEYLAQPGAGF